MSRITRSQGKEPNMTFRHVVPVALAIVSLSLAGLRADPPIDDDRPAWKALQEIASSPGASATQKVELVTDSRQVQHIAFLTIHPMQDHIPQFPIPPDLTVVLDDAANQPVNVVPNQLLQEFQQNRAPLSPNSTISIVEQGQIWQVDDPEEGNVFLLVNEGEEIIVNLCIQWVDLFIWYSNNRWATRQRNGWKGLEPAVSLFGLPPEGLVHDFALTADKDGNAHLLYCWGKKTPLETLAVAYKSRIDGVWSDAETLSSHIGLDVAPCETWKTLDITIGRNASNVESLHIGYLKLDSCRMRTKELPGGAWSGETALGGPGAISGPVKISADRALDRVSVVYIIDGMERFLVHGSSTGGTGWSTDLISASGETPADISRDEAGDVHLLSNGAGARYRLKEGGWSIVRDFAGRTGSAIAADHRDPFHGARILFADPGKVELVKQRVSGDSLEWGPIQELSEPLGGPIAASAFSIDDVDWDHAVYWDGSWLRYRRTHEPNLGAQDSFAEFECGPGTMVNLATGNLVSGLSLVETRGMGFETSLGLVYNSMAASPDLLSSGWTTTYQWTATLCAPETFAQPESEKPWIIDFPDGRSVLFQHDDELGYRIAAPHLGESGKVVNGVDVEEEAEIIYFDKFGNECHFDGDGKLLEVRDLNPDVPPLVIVYEDSPASGEADSLPSKIVDSVDRETVLEYNARFQLETVTDPAGRTIRLDYDVTSEAGFHLLEKIVFESRSALVADGSAFASRDFEHAFTYGLEHDEGDRSRRFRLATAKTPRGSDEDYSTDWFYSQDRRIVECRDPSVTWYTGNTPTTERLSQTVDYTSDADGKATSMATFTDRRGKTTTVSYEYWRGLVSEIRDALGGTVARSFDDSRNTLSLTDMLGHVTTYTYYPSSESEGYTHVSDNLHTTTPPGLPEGKKVTHTYTTGVEAPNRVKTVRDTSGNTVENDYSPTGDLIEVRLPDSTLYDPDDPSTTITQSGVSRTMTYDDVGRITDEVDEEGVLTAYTYEDVATGLCTGVTRAGASGSMTHDVMGNTISRTAANGGVTDSTFDGMDRLTMLVEPEGDAGRAEHRFVFDADGNRIRRLSPDGDGTPLVKMEKSTYDALGRQIRRDVPEEHTPPRYQEHRFDQAGNLVRFRDFNGMATCFSYDDIDRETSRDPFCLDFDGGSVPVDQDGVAAVSLEYDANGNVITQTVESDPPAVTRFEYDARGNLTRTILPATTAKVRGADVSYNLLEKIAYDCGDRPVLSQTRVQAAGEPSVFLAGTFVEYDERSRPKKSVAIDRGASNDLGEDWTACASGTVAAPLITGTATYFRYNLRTDMKEWAVRPSGSLTSVPDSTDHVAGGLDHDELGRQIELLDADGTLIESRVYGVNTVEILRPDATAAEGASAALVRDGLYELNARGELTSETDATGRVDTYEYNLAGNVSRQADSDGNATTFEYDTLGRVITLVEIPAVGPRCVMRYVYDISGNVTRIVDSDGSAYTYGYDFQDRLTRYVNPTGGTDRLSYDERGRLETTTDAAGRTVTYGYDAMDRVIATTHGDGTTITRNLDPFNGIRTISNGSVSVEHRSDARHRPARTTLSIGGVPFKTLTREYDLAGNRVRLTGPEGEIWRWTYDADSRITGMTKDGEDVLESIVYDAAGRARRVELGNGVTSLYTYDASERVTSVEHRRGAETVASWSYTYDDLGNLTGMAQEPLGLTVTYTLDDLSRLVAETGVSTNPPLPDLPPYTNEYLEEPAGNGSELSDEVCSTPIPIVSVPSYVTTYAYDCRGNRTAKTSTLEGDSTYTYDSNNRLTRETFVVDEDETATVTYAYDTSGNLISRTVPDGITGVEAGVYSYAYDARDRLVSYTSPDGTWSYTYSPEGQRLSAVKVGSPGSLRRWIHDGDDVIADYDASGDVEALYANGLGVDSRVARFDGAGASADSHWFAADALGNSDWLLNESGAVENYAHRTAWGSAVVDSSPVDNRHGFSGREHDAESGLMHFRARAYDPRLGRFLQIDPVEENRITEHYVYGANNPLRFADPMGEDVTAADWRYMRRARNRLQRHRREGRADAYSKTYNELQTYAADLLERQGWYEWLDREKAYEFYDQVAALPPFIGRPTTAQINKTASIERGIGGTLGRHRAEFETQQTVLRGAEIAGDLASLALGGGAIIQAGKAGLKILATQGGKALMKSAVKQGGKLAAGTAAETAVDYGLQAAGVPPELIEPVKLAFSAGRKGLKRPPRRRVRARRPRAVIGKEADLETHNIRRHEYTLLDRLPNQGNPRANWKQNSSVLRQEIRKGRPIRDASVDWAGRLRDETGFLRMERNLLRNQGWRYNTITRTWNPPR